MAFQLTTSYPRLWSLDAGVAMVVTDLHGDWDAYARYRDHFIGLRAAGQADCLIFTGDLIHREPGAGADRSLDMVLDILALRERYGDAVISLCGNHELPHVYGFVLGKGRTEYTPGFEAALSQSGRRDKVLELFESLPSFIRTAAGVSIAHAGASAPLVNRAQATSLFDWDHQALRAWAEERLAEGDRAELRSSVEYGPVRSILTQSSGFIDAFDYTLNPYSGYTFGCSYCYAAAFVRDQGRRVRWGQWMRVKENALELRSICTPSAGNSWPGHAPRRSRCAASAAGTKQPTGERWTCCGHPCHTWTRGAVASCRCERCCAVLRQPFRC